MTRSPRSLTAHLETTASHGPHSCVSRPRTEAPVSAIRPTIGSVTLRAATPSSQPGRQ
jgi:hypothetical protein